jgi:pyruvate dehydrogenase E2 component (dihydrolipoamide acetyltransferase)
VDPNAPVAAPVAPKAPAAAPQAAAAPVAASAPVAAAAPKSTVPVTKAPSTAAANAVGSIAMVVGAVIAAVFVL